MSKPRVCLSLYSKPVCDVFQGKAQSSSTLGGTDTAMPSLSSNGNSRTKISGVFYFLPHLDSGSANNNVKKFEGKRPEDRAGHWTRGVAWKGF